MRAELKPKHHCSFPSWFSVGKVVAATVVTVAGGVGGTIIYAKWDHKFRAAVEKNVPYSDWLFHLALGPTSQDGGIPIRKQVSARSHLIITWQLSKVFIYIFWFCKSKFRRKKKTQRKSKIQWVNSTVINSCQCIKQNTYAQINLDISYLVISAIFILNVGNNEPETWVKE